LNKRLNGRGLYIFIGLQLSISLKELSHKLSVVLGDKNWLN
jgi:hypothetical protein